MALPTIYWFTKIADYAARIFPLAASILGFLAWGYNIIEVMIFGALNVINAKVATLDLSSFAGADFSGWEYIGVVNAIFPLSEAVGILGAYFTAWVTIIGLRWIKSFIPTVSN